ncbi:MAG: alpha/beta hydrolase family protein [Armatimonadota bacterium]
MPAEKTAIQWDGGAVSTIWHHPAHGETYLVLGHGAGGTLHTPGLAQFADAIAARSLGAVRFNFPYAEARRKVPDRQKILEACYRAVAGEVAKRAQRLLLGGRSMGGRIASHIVADGFPAAGLVFLGYPLHPPGQPDRLRDAHLEKITVPMLFLQGSRDAFARPDLLTATTARLKTATLHILEGADHGLTVRGRRAEDVIGELVETTVFWVKRL